MKTESVYFFSFAFKAAIIRSLSSLEMSLVEMVKKKCFSSGVLRIRFARR